MQWLFAHGCYPGPWHASQQQLWVMWNFGCPGMISFGVLGINIGGGRVGVWVALGLPSFKRDWNDTLRSRWFAMFPSSSVVNVVISCSVPFVPVSCAFDGRENMNKKQIKCRKGFHQIPFHPSSQDGILGSSQCAEFPSPNQQRLGDALLALEERPWNAALKLRVQQQLEDNNSCGVNSSSMKKLAEPVLLECALWGLKL